MLLQIVRSEWSEISTIGDFLIDGIFHYYSLEDADRQRREDGSIIPWEARLKIPGATAIPYGRYEVITNYSIRFRRVMPLVMGVPDFKGIRIHSGNDHADTEGCPLIGLVKAADYVGRSVKAFEDFFPRLEAALGEERVYLEISKGG